MQDKFFISSTEIQPGTQVDLQLEVAKLPTHTPLHLPVHVFRGRAPGPAVLLTAGLHGDEVNGTETIRRLVRKKALMPDAGAIVAMPIVNVYGFLAQSRDLPDGKDLNRSFPGSKSGSLARRLAHTLLNQVVQHIDWGIDLHTGGARRTNYPQVRCDFRHEHGLAMGKAFGAPFLMDSPEIPGSFRKAAGKLGKNIIVFEGGESQRFDELAINEAMDGIQRVMAHLGMVPERVAPRGTMILERSTWIRAKYSGMVRNLVGAGAEVKKGDAIATLGDPYGKTEHIVSAPSDGFIIGRNNQPVIYAGDALIHLGMRD